MSDKRPFVPEFPAADSRPFVPGWRITLPSRSGYSWTEDKTTAFICHRRGDIVDGWAVQGDTYGERELSVQMGQGRAVTKGERQKLKELYQQAELEAKREEERREDLEKAPRPTLAQQAAIDAYRLVHGCSPDGTCEHENVDVIDTPKAKGVRVCADCHALLGAPDIIDPRYDLAAVDRLARLTPRVHHHNFDPVVAQLTETKVHVLRVPVAWRWATSTGVNAFTDDVNIAARAHRQGLKVVSLYE